LVFNTHNRTAPLPSSTALELLQDLYYNKQLTFGRDKLFHFIRQNHEDVKVSRRQVWDWLKSQEIHQLNNKHSKAKNIKSTLLKNPHRILAIDLVDLQNFEKNGYNYLFNGVDLFSRYVYSIPMKSKTDKSALEAFKKIHKSIPDLKAIRSDNGSEFISIIFKKYLKDNDIKQVLSSAGNPQSNGSIERLNQTLKYLLQKQIQMDMNYDWVKNIPILVDNINKTYHTQIKTTPQAVEDEIDNKVYIEEQHEIQKTNKRNNSSIQKFKVGDSVRIHQPSEKFKSLKWSKEIYKVEKVYKPKKEYSVYEYKLTDFSDKFMEEDLQKIDDVKNESNQEKFFKISKLVKPVIRKNKPHYEVAWVGYRGNNTIELRDNLIKDVPKMVKLFEKRNGVEFRTDKNGKVYVYMKPNT
jgi:hypothetical protein